MFCSRCGQAVTVSAIFCAHCGQRLADSGEAPPDLQARIAALEGRLPDSDVIDPRFWTRARAIWGHSVAVTALLYGLFFVAMLIASAFS
jgi:hypothetical protein